MGTSCLVSGGFCFLRKKTKASALKQYTRFGMKTGFVNKFVDFCTKNRLRGGKRFYQEDSSVVRASEVRSSVVRASGLRASEVRSLEVGTQQGFFQQQQDFQRIQQVEQGLLERSIEAAFLFLFWLQTWLHNLQFALNTAFANVKQVSIIQSVYSGSGWKSGCDAERRNGFVGGRAEVVSSVVGCGFSLVPLSLGAVLRFVAGYVVGFQDGYARGAGVRATTPTSIHLWVCYQKFFRFWANAKTQTKTLIAMNENTQNVQKHARQVLYIALDLLNCLLKNKNTPDVFASEWTKNALKNKKSSALICYQKFFRFWVFCMSRFRQHPKMSFCRA